MITDHKGDKWSNKQLLEKVEMQTMLMNKLKDHISMLDTEIIKLKDCHIAAEKELIEKEQLVEKLQERLEATTRQLNDRTGTT